MGFCKIYRAKWRHAILAGMPCESLLSLCCMTRTKSGASKRCFRKSWLHPETRLGRSFFGNGCGCYAPRRPGELPFERWRLEPARLKNGPPADGRPVFFAIRPSHCTTLIVHIEFSDDRGRSHDHDRHHFYDRTCSALARRCRSAV